MTEGLSEQNAFEERLRLKIEAYHDSALLYAAVKLGLPERMRARAWTADALAAELGLSPPHLHRFLRGLTSLGICAEHQDGTFALTLAGQCSGAGLALAALAKSADRRRAILAALGQSRGHGRNGQTRLQHVFGMNVADWRRDHAEQGALFDSYLAQETFAQAPAIVAALDFSGVRHVADIGGGYGGLLAAILQAHPRLTGILFDRPHRIEAAMPFLQSQGVAARVQRIGGDLLDAVPVAADLYLLNGVLQQWDDARRRSDPPQLPCGDGGGSEARHRRAAVA